MTPRDAATLQWVRVRIAAAGGHPPTFGSAAWHALPDHDPRKIAGVVAAACCWWNEARPETIAVRLADELSAAAWVDDQQWAAMAARVRRRANMRSLPELRRLWAS